MDTTSSVNHSKRSHPIDGNNTISTLLSSTAASSCEREIKRQRCDASTECNDHQSYEEPIEVNLATMHASTMTSVNPVILTQEGVPVLPTTPPTMLPATLPTPMSPVTGTTDVTASSLILTTKPDVSKEFECIVCFSLPPDVLLQCNNGHLFCQSCWEGMQDAARIGHKLGKVTCPTCRTPLGRTPARNRLAESILASLPVACFNFGCDDRPLFRELFCHVNDRCHHRLLACKYKLLGCAWYNAAHTLAQHESECEWKHKTADQLLPLIQQKCAQVQQLQQVMQQQHEMVRFLRARGHTMAVRRCVFAERYRFHAFQGESRWQLHVDMTQPRLLKLTQLLEKHSETPWRYEFLAMSLCTNNEASVAPNATVEKPAANAPSNQVCQFRFADDVAIMQGAQYRIFIAIIKRKSGDDEDDSADDDDVGVSAPITASLYSAGDSSSSDNDNNSSSSSPSDDSGSEDDADCDDDAASDEEVEDLEQNEDAAVSEIDEVPVSRTSLSRPGQVARTHNPDHPSRSVSVGAPVRHAGQPAQGTHTNRNPAARTATNPTTTSRSNNSSVVARPSSSSSGSTAAAVGNNAATAGPRRSSGGSSNIINNNNNNGTGGSNSGTNVRTQSNATSSQQQASRTIHRQA